MGEEDDLRRGKGIAPERGIYMGMGEERENWWWPVGTGDERKGRVMIDERSNDGAAKDYVYIGEVFFFNLYFGLCEY